MKNRRTAKRFDNSLSLEIYTDDRLVLGNATNLSEGGVGVTCDRRVEASSVVRMILFLLEEGIEAETVPPVYLQGKVIWCKQIRPGRFTAGIRFLPLQPQQRERLQVLLRRLSGKD